MKKEVDLIIAELLRFSPHLLEINNPVLEEEIARFESKFNLPLPEDYKYLLSITNGFSLMGDEVLGIAKNKYDLVNAYQFEHYEVINPQYELYFPYDLVYPGDEDYVLTYNEAKRDKPNKQFILNIPPEPWTGNILNSRLIVLSLNPGYVEHLNKNLANMFRPQMAEEIMEDKRKVLLMEGSTFDYYEPTRILGDYYWRKNILPLGTAVYGEQNKEKIFNQISLCQYLAYTSSDSPSIKSLFPSQKYTKMVLLYLATSVKYVKFLVLRAAAKWKILMGEGLWNYLLDNNRLLVSEHYRSQCLTEKNVGVENYRIIVDHLKNV